MLQAFRGRHLVGSRVLAYDTTNFHTWIATTNTRNTLAQRGRNKQKRHDLRQVGLAYALDAQHGLSLCHHVYPGAVPDSEELPAALGRLERMLERAGIAREEVTLVLDKGSAALDNTLELQQRGLGWVAALPWNQAPGGLARNRRGGVEARRRRASRGARGGAALSRARRRVSVRGAALDGVRRRAVAQHESVAGEGDAGAAAAGAGAGQTAGALHRTGSAPAPRALAGAELRESAAELRVERRGGAAGGWSTNSTMARCNG